MRRLLARSSGSVIASRSASGKGEHSGRNLRNPAPPPRVQDQFAAGAGHAQGNVGQRLAYAFSKRARMTAGWDGGYYQAGFRVPLDGGASR